MADTEEVTDRRTVPFADTLQRLQSGKTARELAEAMQTLVEQVMETGRAGTLTLQIKVSKSKASGMVEVSDNWVSKPPKLDRPVSMFYVTDDHNLVRDNPRQETLPGLLAVRVDDPKPATALMVAE